MHQEVSLCSCVGSSTQLIILGSVSSAAWAAVCKRVLLTAEEVVKDLLAPAATPMPSEYNSSNPKSM